MKVEFGPVQHTEVGDQYNILVDGVVIGIVYPDTGYAHINEDKVWEIVDEALQKRFGKSVDKLEID